MKGRSDWQEMKKHDEVTRAVLRETCVVSKEGYIMVFHGEPFWKQMKVQGHTSMDYERCSCRPSDWGWLTLEEIERRGIPTGAIG